MIDYRANPFFLNEEDIRWVEKTAAAMSVDEKIGQIFCPLIFERDPDKVTAMERQYQFGGAVIGGSMSSREEGRQTRQARFRSFWQRTWKVAGTVRAGREPALARPCLCRRLEMRSRHTGLAVSVRRKALPTESTGRSGLSSTWIAIITIRLSMCAPSAAMRRR